MDKTAKKVFQSVGRLFQKKFWRNMSVSEAIRPEDAGLSYSVRKMHVSIKNFNFSKYIFVMRN